MKIVFLLICVFLALAGVAGLPAPFELAEEDGLYGEPRRFAPKYSPNQLAKGIKMKDNKKQEENGRLTKRSPGGIGPAVAPGPGPGVYSAYEPAVGPYLRPQMSSIKSKRDISKKSPGEDKPGKRIISKRSDEASSPFNVMQILEGIQMVKDIYEKSQSKLSPKDQARNKRSPFDLAEAEADPRKKRSPEGDARKKLAAEANHRRNKRSPFEVASESDTEFSVRETEAYP